MSPRFWEVLSIYIYNLLLLRLDCAYSDWQSVKRPYVIDPHLRTAESLKKTKEYEGFITPTTPDSFPFLLVSHKRCIRVYFQLQWTCFASLTFLTSLEELLSLAV